VEALARAVAALGHTVHVQAPTDPLAVKGHDSLVGVSRFPYSPLGSLQPMGYGKALHNDRRLRLTAWLCAAPYFLSAVSRLLTTSGTWDLLHVHWLLPNGPPGVLTGRLVRKPVVVTLHGSDAFLAQSSRLLGPLARWSRDGASAVTACSPDMAGFRAEIIPWGAHPQKFVHSDPLRWREGLGIPVGRPIVVALGRLVEKKGFSCLLRAWKQVENAVLVVGGDGVQRRLLEELAAALGISERVIFCGAIPWTEVPDFLAMAEAVAIPSVRDASGNQDGLPMVALEAMAAGKPVVASALGGLPLVVQDGVTGRLVPPDDPEALATALLELLASPVVARAMGQAGRERVECELNWDNVARRYVEVYEQALQRSRGAARPKAAVPQIKHPRGL